LSSVNVRLGSPQDRVLLTGLHTVQDAFCASCDERLGWRYVKAAAPSQRYKEGCFILEQARVYQVRGIPLRWGRVPLHPMIALPACCDARPFRS
jgi:hypothetical protein